ncbi:APEX nuclease (apurinic/apyrimidinic endonuclease) 2 [Ectocarpus siliculosus]|uniref:APEX nuclease (Apurinic/apyrimidinic endonuclease) 2 n=1 Tax=Ectocarpus siliculosus TaxID=2880 RepID=D8LL51_ECTSI|nr:APEX nuclease (apurinic/apyrimidinic endonuclease) 2 [Ectocarpus siliculosus]|eukprot:CBN79670.1 APEX nuclease (apurinic/apyrimidinic endonuclease) 2 [Ectocarpus siliculosus]
MDAITLVAYTFEVGSSLLERCELVKQCHTESGRIAVRTARVLGALQKASNEFSCRMEFEASLRELKRVLEEARDLVSRCQKARGVGAKIGALMGANSLKAGLVRVERDLDRAAADLQIPMLTDIRRAVQCINERESEATASPSGIDAEMLEQAVRDAIRKELCNTSQGRAVDDIIKDNLSKLYEAEAAVAADQQGYSPPPDGAGGRPLLCSGHGEECALRTTKKEGPNKGRHFYNCARPGNQRCSSFTWADKKPVAASTWGGERGRGGVGGSAAAPVLMGGGKEGGGGESKPLCKGHQEPCKLQVTKKEVSIQPTEAVLAA